MVVDDLLLAIQACLFQGSRDTSNIARDLESAGWNVWNERGFGEAIIAVKLVWTSDGSQ